MLAWPGWTRRINELFPLRYLAWALCGLLALFFAISWTAGLTDGLLALVFLALAVGNQYAWSHHHPPAVKAGVTQQELDSLESGGALSDTISAPEKAAIRYAREFGQGGKVTDETFAEAKRHFSERQITDLTLLCGYFMALGSTINALRVDLEPNFPPKAKRV